MEQQINKDLIMLQIAQTKLLLEIKEILKPKTDDNKMTREEWEKLMDF